MKRLICIIQGRAKFNSAQIVKEFIIAVAVNYCCDCVYVLAAAAPTKPKTTRKKAEPEISPDSFQPALF